MLSPDFVVVADVGEFGAHIDGVAVGSDAAADQRGHAEIAADLLRVHILALVAEDGIARLHFEVGNVREVADQRFGDAVAEVVHPASPPSW